MSDGYFCSICGTTVSNEDVHDGLDLIKRNLPKKDWIMEKDIVVCKSCAVNYIKKELAEGYKNYLEPMFNLVNKMGYDSDGFQVEAFANAICSNHRYLQSEWMLFLLKVMKLIGQRADNNNWVDQRNDALFHLCRTATKDLPI